MKVLLLACLVALPAAAEDLAPDEALGVDVRLADGLYDAGQKDDAYVAYQHVADSYRGFAKRKITVGASGVDAAAKSEFRLVETIVAESEAITFDDTKTLPANIKKRLLLLKPLREAYERIVREYPKSEWAIAALDQIGKVSEDFVVAMSSSAMPAELKTEEQREMYRLELREQFQPVVDMAIAYYGKSLELAAKSGIDDEYSRHAAAGRLRLLPATK